MPPLLPTILAALLTSLVVAVIGLFAEHKSAGLGRAFHPGALGSTLALGLAFLVALRMAIGGWPDFPPAQGVDWLLYISIALVVAAPLFQLRWFHSIVGPAAMGLIAGGAMAEWPLRNILTNSMSANRGPWTWGIAIGMALACAAAALACIPTRDSRALPGRSILTRLRDDHWGTFAIGLLLAFAAPAVIFSSSIKFGQAMLGLGMGWAGVAIVGLFARLALSGAAALAMALYAALWIMTYLLAKSSTPAFALAALAPLGLLVGYLKPLRHRPWLRFVATCAAAAGLSAAAAGMLAPAYIKGLQQDSGGSESE